MKDFFSNLWLAILILFLFVGAIIGIVSFCEPFVTMLGNGSLLRGIILMPFGIFGVIQFIRGIFRVLGADAEAFESYGQKNYWKFCIYVLLNIFSYFALIIIFRSIQIP